MYFHIHLLLRLQVKHRSGEGQSIGSKIYLEWDYELTEQGVLRDFSASTGQLLNHHFMYFFIYFKHLDPYLEYSTILEENQSD